MNRHNWTMIVCAILGSLFLSSCAYHGLLKQDFYQPSQATAQKIPLSVAIYPNVKHIDEIKTTGGLGNRYKIEVKDGILSAIKIALTSIFEKACIIEHIADTNEFDFSVYPFFKINLVSKDAWSGTQIFESELRLSFRNFDNVEVANYSDKQRIQVEPTAGTTALSVLTGASLFLLSPITIPAIAQAGGRHGISLVEKHTSKSLDIITEDITRDKKKLIFARSKVYDQDHLFVNKQEIGTDRGHDRTVGERWAVIIGISNYLDTRIPYLRYASNDAKAFYDWVVSRKGGKYAPSRVKMILDQDSTSRNIKNALFVWLGQALAEDVVTIYFAGHGSPQSPDNPDNLFLLSYDVNYDDVASTGFPMWDIETALKRFIKAQKVIVIADACHAGGVGRSFDVSRRASRGIEINPISSGLQSLSKVGDGVCVISASDDKEFSQESKNWGGGHGVFTHFMLKGLKGEADYNKDTLVTLGELIPYLSEQVRRATRNAQCPTVAGKFDPVLSIGR